MDSVASRGRGGLSGAANDAWTGAAGQGWRGGRPGVEGQPAHTGMDGQGTDGFRGWRGGGAPRRGRARARERSEGEGEDDDEGEDEGESDGEDRPGVRVTRMARPSAMTRARTAAHVMDAKLKRRIIHA